MVAIIKWPVLLLCFLLLGACGNSNNNAKEERATIKKIHRLQQKTAPKRKPFCFSAIVTAGYGLDMSQAFPALIQQKIDSLNLPYQVVNAGVKRRNICRGNSRVDWILKQPVHIFVLELGANDGLRGIPVEETRKNLQSIIDKVKAKYPDAKMVLAGMQVPPNMGRQYAADFRNLFPQLAQKNNAVLVPFLLEGVGGIATLNLQDGIHPTAEGHAILAQNVWKVLQPHL